MRPTRAGVAAPRPGTARSATTPAVGYAPPADLPRLSQTAVGVRLLRRLDAALAHPTAETVSALRAAVTELADRVKASGYPPERATAALGAMLREHAAGAPEDAALRARLLGWCVRAYHDDDWW